MLGMERKCPQCQSTTTSHSAFGSFVRRSDGRRLKRFRCGMCFKTFSEATYQKCYRQKKRRLNPCIRHFLCSGMSQRRIALILKISRTTVERKFLFLAQLAREENQADFRDGDIVQEMQFDDLETIEHTKCKPLSVTIAVEKTRRRILGFQVSVMPAKGHLAKKSRKKYGHRPDERAHAREKLFESLAPKILPTAVIQSDQSPHYPESVRKWFPQAAHITTKGLRGCVAGQGELKKAGFDPLFSLNHTFAMLRANINRLFRKTWCTTKKKERLRDHIELYVNYHNRLLIASA